MATREFSEITRAIASARLIDDKRRTDIVTLYFQLYDMQINDTNFAIIENQALDIIADAPCIIEFAKRPFPEPVQKMLTERGVKYN